jgi:Cys-tRNA(Pro)/Cys-tRNA(Cys) deacylase
VAGKETPAVRAARAAQIDFRLHEYEHDPSHPSYALEAAERTGVEPARIFKTLVADVDGELRVVLVPGDREVDLRALGKRAALADQKRAERTTGYVAGGISPLGQRRALPTVVDQSALEHATVFVSAGRRGLEIELDPRDLVALTKADVAAIAR